MPNIGCHLSSSKGFANMAKTALSINADTFQFFTRNPRGGAAKSIDEKDVANFIEICKNHSFGTLVAHAPYTLNACAKDERIREFAYQTMQDDLQRMEYIPGNVYNFHPGSHVGQGTQEGIRLISKQLNDILTPQQTTTVLLETMAGKGSEIGRSFEELQQILAQVNLQEKMGVCLDTCHVWDAGYDLVNDLDGVLAQFDKTIGLQNLKAIHLNDSLNEKGAAKDRHAKIGEGKIGFEALLRIYQHPALAHLPFCLETPNELDGYAKEIQMMRTGKV